MTTFWKGFWIVLFIFAIFCVYKKKTALPKDSCRIDLEAKY
jgi:hypothetical protein